MLVRAASSDGEMVRILGLPAATICSAVFGVGAALAGLAGAISAPLFPIELGMATIPSSTASSWSSWAGWAISAAWSPRPY
ncbi:hypothetical protein G6F68_019284 [Rhizopus microsporus]|nr:hypothetical protein G6F68_019284 [Rhizopus microsporus]